jgi:hypothetical protein
VIGSCRDLPRSAAATVVIWKDLKAGEARCRSAPRGRLPRRRGQEEAGRR